MNTAWVKLILFGVISFGFIWGSWEALKDPRKHGYYRFFAFECILALIILNYRAWFVDPFSTRQVFSWVLLITSLYLAAAGFYMLKKVGKPIEGIEDTTTLVESGVYRYIRHPLYASLIIFGWGAALKDPSLAALALAAVNTGFLFGAASVEEGENIKSFGTRYDKYRQRTKMFVPFVF